jgi:hypothetical protein
MPLEPYPVVQLGVHGFRRLALLLCPDFGKVFKLFHPPAYFSIVSSTFEDKKHS